MDKNEKRTSEMWTSVKYVQVGDVDKRGMWTSYVYKRNVVNKMWISVKYGQVKCGKA